MNAEPLLKVSNLKKTFNVGKGSVLAVDHVSFDVARGECLAIVGESGSGKSTIASMILGIYPPSSGSIMFAGEPLPDKRLLEHRHKIQLVQQNPLSSLNPRRSIGASLRLALDVHGHGQPSQRNGMIAELLEEVGLSQDMAKRSPSTLSGGQRQRVAIARALACQSDLIVLDEPTSALDVLVQARVLRLLDDLRKSRDLTYIFITHDLSVVRNIADRVAVFEAGELLELAHTQTLFEKPEHIYTKKLISAVPVVGEDEIALRARIKQSAAHSEVS